MSKNITEIMREYGISAQEIMKQREYPEFDFSIFEGMDQKYDKIRATYRRVANNNDYSAEFKAAKKQEAMAAIKALKTEYHQKATKWIDKTYRRPKPKKKGPSAFTLTTNDMVLQELQRTREFTVLQEQIKVEPAEKLLELYRERKDDSEAVTLIELELRQRKDKGGSNESVRAMHAWAEIQADLYAGDIVAEHHERQLISALHPDDQWYPRGLEKGYREAKYEPIEL